MVEYKLIIIIFSREHLRAGKVLAREEGFFPHGENGRSRGTHAYASVATLPDTWDVTRERINRLWSVQMQHCPTP